MRVCAQCAEELSHAKSIAIQRGPRKREEGFQSAVFCPIPIGDSPSSKRMYDVVNVSIFVALNYCSFYNLIFECLLLIVNNVPIWFFQYGCIPVVLSDDLVWAYSTEAGGPLDASTFSIQVPQSTVLKSALHVLTALGVDASLTNSTATAKVVIQEKSKKGNINSIHDKLHILNYGRSLPGGTSVLTLLREIAEEDRVAALSENNNETSVGSTLTRRLSLESLSDFELDLLQASNRYLVTEEPDEDAKKPAWAGKGMKKGTTEKKKKGPGAEPSGTNKGTAGKATTSRSITATRAKTASTQGMSNTLIRLLSKISAQDIARLQEGVRNVSRFFQFYALNSTLRTDVTPPAVHLRPTGGAMEMLEHALLQRKKAGIYDVGRRCQEERNRPGHKYIGNYPCEKRR